MKWYCDNKLNQIVKEAERDANDCIEMRYIQAVSKPPLKAKKETSKIINTKLVEDFLKRRGYTNNYVLGKPVMVKGFTCVYVQNTCVEVWHDKTNNDKSVFVDKSLLTGLPITLNYMERI
jgi:hypothetical protein